MSPTEPGKALSAVPSQVDRRIVVLAVLATIASTLIAWLYAGRISIGPFEVSWIAAQAFLLTTPGIVIARLVHKRNPLVASIFGSLWVLAVPLLMLLDAITFHWIGDRFLSPAVWRVVTDLRTALSGHVTVNMAATGAIALLGCSVSIALMCWSAERIADAWANRSTLPGPTLSFLAGLCLVGLFSIPAPVNFPQTRRTMAKDSSRHPLCVFGLVPFRGVGDAAPDTGQATVIRSLESAVVARDHQQRRLTIDRAESDFSNLPDVLIVVVESFRRELIEPEVMPNLWEYATKGIHCRTHFSGGNATNHGLFSLLNGLEAIWYERPVRYTPLLNRLFREAGYELGFFAGHDDWRKFYMDGYLSDEHFDVFEIAKPEGLKSDRRATELASMFLDRKDAATEDRRPRLALLYLYATHATYNSYVEDQHFQPAADDRFIYPFSESVQPAVWNRYKNSARTVDRFLNAVMRDDRVVIVTGDHGESFLDDDTIGHGIRISEFQNMTPAVIYVPGGTPRSIEAATSHADLLPTLVSAVGLRLSSQTTLDGVDLNAARDESLSDRIFVTRNYLHDDVGLIGPWTIRNDKPFAYRISVSLREMKINPINAIDSRGYEMSAHKADPLLKDWSKMRFGPFGPE